MSDFNDIFSIGVGPDEPEPPEEDEQEVETPVWLGAPDDELGVSVGPAVVVGRSQKAVVALKNLIVYSTGVTLELAAAARGMKESDVHKLFHEQHMGTVGAELSPGFLRVGVELANGARVANVQDRRKLWQETGEPAGPVLIESGGGGGGSSGRRVTMNPAFWLWPLPPAGPMRLFVEWPLVDLALSSVELDAARITEAASRARPLWND